LRIGGIGLGTRGLGVEGVNSVKSFYNMKENKILSSKRPYANFWLCPHPNSSGITLPITRRR